MPSDPDPKVSFRCSIAPWLSVQDSAKALHFYKSAFGATEVYRLDVPGGGVVARLSVGGAEFWLSEESEGDADSKQEPSAESWRSRNLSCPRGSRLAPGPPRRSLWTSLGDRPSPSINFVGRICLHILALGLWLGSVAYRSFGGSAKPALRLE
jgi:hypothetical protein